MTQKSLKIVLISQWYEPEPIPFPHDIATELRRRGHKVKVMTGFPNYPSGRLYPGYHQHFNHTEVFEGVHVHRHPLKASHDSSPLNRALNYLTFASSASCNVRLLKGADVAFIYGTPLTVAIPALLAKRWYGVPYVLQVQDLWPDSITASGMVATGKMRDGIAHLVERLASHIYRNASAVIGIAEKMSRELIRRGSPTHRTHTVYNWSPSETERPTVRRKRTGPTRFLYAGNLGEVQDLETVIRAARLAEDNCDLEVLLVGDGVMSERLKTLATSLGSRSVRFAGRVPAEQMHEQYSAADFSLVTLMNHDVFSMTVPSKFQASLARGLPVVTTVPGEVTAICERYECGLTAPSGDPLALAETMRRAAALPRDEYGILCDNSQTAYLDLFTRSSAIDAIETILSNVSAEIGSK